jgi:hypothetical protein
MYLKKRDRISAFDGKLADVSIKEKSQLVDALVI